jgi:hypothetical protein
MRESGKNVVMPVSRRAGARQSQKINLPDLTPNPLKLTALGPTPSRRAADPDPEGSTIYLWTLDMTSIHSQWQPLSVERIRPL